MGTIPNCEKIITRYSDGEGRRQLFAFGVPVRSCCVLFAEQKEKSVENLWRVWTSFISPFFWTVPVLTPYFFTTRHWSTSFEMDPFSANYALASAAALHPLLGPTALYLDYHPLRQLQRKIPPPPPPDQLPASPSSLSSSLSTCSDNSKKMVKDSSSGEEAAAKRLKSQTAPLPDDNIGQQTANVECVVCGDKSSGKHYGQLTCEGCKSFFKRSVRRNVQYVCRNNNDCPVDLNHRNQCQHCRLRKCYEAGMRREAVQRGRVPLSFQPFHHNGQDLYKLPAVASSAVHQRKDCSPKPSKASVEAFPDFITQLLTAEPYSPSLGSGFVLSNVENGLLGIDQLGELSARILFTTIEWARNLHIFNALKLTDQIILLCSSWSELFLLNMAQCNVILHAASFLAATNFYSPPAPNIMTGGDRVLHLMDQICKFQGKVEKLRSLKLNAAEYACLKALALFSSDMTTHSLELTLSYDYIENSEKVRITNRCRHDLVSLRIYLLDFKIQIT
uniref:Uncharacterized protein n=1 Tax=Romanomermis culicivorax TaxID=13658 RepID=A0A915L6M9_ROMCU